MKATDNVFVASAVRNERILLILQSWKCQTSCNWFTGISTKRDSSKSTPRFCTNWEKTISQSWETIELVLICFSFDFEPMEILITLQQVNIIWNKQNKNWPDSSFYKPFVHGHSCIFSNKMPNMQVASNKLTYFTHKKCLLRGVLALVTPHEHQFKYCEKCTLKLLGIA